MTRITNIALVFVIAVFTAALSLAQRPSSERAALAESTDPAIGVRRTGTLRSERRKGTRYKVDVTNRASIPDSLWQQRRICQRVGRTKTQRALGLKYLGRPATTDSTGFAAFVRQRIWVSSGFRCRQERKGRNASIS